MLLHRLARPAAVVAAARPRQAALERWHEASSKLETLGLARRRAVTTGIPAVLAPALAAVAALWLR